MQQEGVNANHVADDLGFSKPSQTVCIPAITGTRAIHREWIRVLVLAVLAGWMLFYRLGADPLTHSHEARAAQNAQTILDSGDWLLPRLFDRQVELQKPPLYYWLVALCGLVNGGQVDSWCVRLPSAMSSWLLVIGLYIYVSRTHPQAALWSAVVLGTMVRFTLTARSGQIDMPLTLTVSVAVCTLSHAIDAEHRVGCLLLGYMSIACAMLLKGPIGLILPLAIIAPVAVMRVGVSEAVRRTGAIWGIPLALAIAAPWYVIVDHLTRGALLRQFIWYHNVTRGLGTSAALATHPWWYYVPRLAIDALPWSLCFPPACFVLATRADLRHHHAIRVALVWCIVPFGLFSIAAFKRAEYLLPMYPGLAICIGVALTHILDRGGIRMLAGRQLPIVIMITAAIAWTFAPVMTPEQSDVNLASQLRTSSSEPVIFFRVEDHHLAWHVKPPIVTLLEWENLRRWVERRGEIAVVLSSRVGRELQQRLGSAYWICERRVIRKAGERPPLLWLRIRRNEADRTDAGRRQS